MSLHGLKVDVAVVLGKTRMPLGRMLRIGRGAVVSFDGPTDQPVEILANGLAIARGRIVVTGSAIGVEVTELVRKPEANRVPGSTIGGHLKLPDAPTAPADAS